MHGFQIKTLLSLTLGLALLLTGAVSSLAADDEAEATNLSINPLGTSESYFTVTASPGETLELEVELRNHGSAAAEARVYAADVYSLINGGFGVELDDEETSGVTEWLDFEPQTLEMDAESAVQRGFAVTVPDDIEPGEYVTALVIQNANPTGGPASGIGFKQVNRQAIAVAITIPGEMQAALTIGEAHHKFTGSRSVVTVEVDNPGTAHLSPEGEFSLIDQNGEEVLSKPVTMNTVYSGTETLLEVGFPEALEEGEYQVSLALEDPESGVEADMVGATIAVPVHDAPPPASSNQQSSGEAGTQGIREASTANTAQESALSGIPVWMLAGSVVVALVAGAGVTFGVIAFARKRQSGSDDPSEAKEVATQPAASESRPAPYVVTTVDERPVAAAKPAVVHQHREAPASVQPVPATKKDSFGPAQRSRRSVLRERLQQTQVTKMGTSGD